MTKDQEIEALKADIKQINAAGDAFILEVDRLKRDIAELRREFAALSSSTRTINKAIQRPRNG